MSASCVTRCLTLRQSSCVTWLSTALRGWEAHSNALFVSQVRQGGQDKPQRAWLDPEMTLGGFVKYCSPFLGKKKYRAWKCSKYCLSETGAHSEKKHCGVWHRAVLLHGAGSASPPPSSKPFKLYLVAHRCDAFPSAGLARYGPALASPYSPEQGPFKRLGDS